MSLWRVEITSVMVLFYYGVESMKDPPITADVYTANKYLSSGEILRIPHVDTAPRKNIFQIGKKRTWMLRYKG